MRAISGAHNWNGPGRVYLTPPRGWRDRLMWLAGTLRENRDGLIPAALGCWFLVAALPLPPALTDENTFSATQLDSRHQRLCINHTNNRTSARLLWYWLYRICLAAGSDESHCVFGQEFGLRSAVRLGFLLIGPLSTPPAAASTPGSTPGSTTEDVGSAVPESLRLALHARTHTQDQIVSNTASIPPITAWQPATYREIRRLSAATFAAPAPAAGS
jgi:hypothetical protein